MEGIYREIRWRFLANSTLSFVSLSVSVSDLNSLRIYRDLDCDIDLCIYIHVN